MIVKNKDELATSKLRKQALDLVEAGIERVLPSTIMKFAVEYEPMERALTVRGKESSKRYDLSQSRIFVVGGGKASGKMAETLETIIDPEHITAGIVNCRDTDYETSRIEIVQASYPEPVPDEKGVAGVKRMLSLKDEYSIDEHDLVICLISGGGSALMPCPVDEITLEDKKRMTQLLLGGPNIHQFNAVRKHLSKVKGGRLAQHYAPARVVSLVISDVIGNDCDVIASGPTVHDPSTFEKAYKVLEDWGLLAKTPHRVREYLENRKGKAGEAEETPKTPLANSDYYLIGDNRLALEAMKLEAERRGLKPYIVTAEQIGDPTEMAQLRAREILGRSYEGHDVILIGGETTPRLPEEHGVGGRNQHYAAVSMLAMEKYTREWALASVGTDGSDFIAEAAGAIVDNHSLALAEGKGIDVESFIERYDSYNLFREMGNSLIVTGNTGTNVCDLMVYMLK